MPFSDGEEEEQEEEEEEGGGVRGRSMSLVHTLVEGTSMNRWETRKRHLSLQFVSEESC